MTLNFTCCKDFKLTSLICCKNGNESPPPSPSPSPSPPPPRKIITLVESDKINFETLLPNHGKYIYLKILANETIVTAAGEFMNDLDMEKEDFIGKNICSIKKNTELFKECICPLFKRSMETGNTYQFCFTLGDNLRMIACNIYPCSIPGYISSADCIIRPVILKGNVDRFAISFI